MDQAEVIEKVKRYRLLLSRHFDLDKVILFGSYAKGKPTVDSDIDVAIVVKYLSEDYFSYAPLIWKIRRDVDDRIEPLIFEKGQDPSGFLDDILKSGIEIPSA